jgi:hypothetical protein
MGTHDELMMQEGHYREIAMVQLYADDDDLPNVPTSKKPEHPSHMTRVQNPLEVAATTAAIEKSEPGEPLGK